MEAWPDENPIVVGAGLDVAVVVVVEGAELVADAGGVADSEPTAAWTVSC